jgi:hypothetical protein
MGSVPACITQPHLIDQIRTPLKETIEFNMTRLSLAGTIQVQIRNIFAVATGNRLVNKSL